VCGIVGAYNLADKKTDSFPEFLGTLNHRGPDGLGIWQEGLPAQAGQISLGQNRLAIIDLSDGGKQPMFLQCAKGKDKFAIVFNGEIYNYESLQRELKKLGHTFSSHSDTEVILHVYEEWGVKGFSKLRGMFALVLWDINKQELVAARDRFGIKPLYYCWSGERFVFASEIKAFDKLSFFKKEIRQEAVVDFLRMGYVSQPQTFYKNILALEPGAFLKIGQQQGRLEIEQGKFADLKDFYLLPKKDMSLDQAFSETKAALLDSIQHHLVADVEVGLFLSGGIDSSIILSLMRELRHDKIKSVSAVFPGTGYDESAKVNELVKRFKTSHLETKITGQDFVEHLDKIIYHLDQPSVDGVNTYFVSLAAKQAGLKVVLSGLGGDELFYGYPSFSDIPKLAAWLPLLNIAGAGGLLSKINYSNMQRAKLAQISQARNLIEVYSTYRANFTDFQISRILGAKSLNREPVNLDIAGIKDRQSLISYLEMRLYLKNQLLRDADVFSMAHSIELRVPFVDSALFKAIVSLPDSYKLSGGIKKFLLKGILKGRVSENILQQKKQGFVVPLELWLKNEAKEILQTELLSSEIFQKKETERLLQRFFAGSFHWSRIWSLFVLNRFSKK